MRSRGWFLLFERSAFSICKITFFSETANDYGKKFVILHAVMEKEATRPLILISNDDGYAAKGINDLIEMVRPMGDVLVCAPDGPRSGQACAFSATVPLTLTQRRKEDGVEVWSCNGSPVDCVKMALANLCPRKPDMVIGGINHGDNASVNTHYSGTMGVTLEGCMKYIPSVAYSLCDYRADADFEPLRPHIQRITRHVLENGLPQGVRNRDFADFEMLFSAVTASKRGSRRQSWPALFIVTTKNLYFKIASHLKKMDFGGRPGIFSKAY
jgi:hypothetical protein